MFVFNQFSIFIATPSPFKARKLLCLKGKLYLLVTNNMRPDTGETEVDRHNSVYVLTLMIGGAARDLLITICQAY